MAMDGGCLPTHAQSRTHGMNGTNDTRGWAISVATIYGREGGREEGRKGGREGGRERGKGKEGAARGWIGICQFGATAMASTDAATVPGSVAEADATNQSRVRMAVGPNTRFILSTSGRLSSMRRWCFVTSPAVSALCDTTL